MGSQGFRNISGNPFVYQEDVRSAAFGLDAAAQTWKVVISNSTGALPTGTAQLTIDPGTNGNVTIDPNGSGNLVVTSGDLSLTAGGISLGNGKIAGIYGQTVGATNGLVQVDNSHKLGATNSPSVTGSVTAGTGFTATTGGVSITAGNLNLPVTSSTGGALTGGFITVNSHRFIHNYGHATGGVQTNIFIGDNTGNLSAANSGYNCIIGEEAAQLLTNSGGGYSGGYNNIVGSQALLNGTTAQFNSGIGSGVFRALTTGYFNTAIAAWACARRLVDGNYNTFIGVCDSSAGGILYYGSGYNYTASESHNILIGNAGVAGESNKIRIGSTGTGTAQQSACYIAGIYGVTPGGTKNIALVDSNGQLGSAATISQSYLTDGMTWNAPTTTPVTAAVNNEYTIKTASGLTTINLPATAAVNTRIKIVGYGVDGWTLVAAAGDYIHYGSLDTTAGGSLSSTNRYDCVEVVCAVADAEWVVHGSNGTLTVA